MSPERPFVAAPSQMLHFTFRLTEQGKMFQMTGEILFLSFDFVHFSRGSARTNGHLIHLQWKAQVIERKSTRCL